MTFRLALCSLLLAAALQPAVCRAAPETFPIALNGASEGVAARDISTYPAAIDAIIRVFVNDLALPIPSRTLEIYPTREEFEAALIQHLGLKPDLARSTAAFAKAAVGGEKAVIVNAVQIENDSWPDRIETLAHELAHTVQLELTGQRPLNRLQWLTEGFAEWAAYRVTDKLGLEDISRVRSRLIPKVRAAQPLPRLAQMNTFAQWIASRTKYGFDATFSQSFFAFEFLQERHSPEAVLNYFRAFQESRSYPANFRTAFGESVSAFQTALDGDLQRLLAAQD